jgi:hypothetical protein
MLLDARLSYSLPNCIALHVLLTVMGHVCVSSSYIFYVLPKPVAARPVAWVCCRSVPGISVSNPTVNMATSLL